MKILFIILDGLGDRPIKKLGNKTPLEAARTPNLDFLAESGVCGLIEPVYQGHFPNSKDVHLSLFGYNLRRWNIGRGVFEVLGIGMRIKKEDVALRGDWATVDEKMKIIDRRAGRIKDTAPFIKIIQGLTIDGVKFLIGAGVEHRVGVIMRGKGLSEKVSDNDLHKIGVLPQKVLPLNKSKEAKFTADILNRYLEKTHLILKEHLLNKKRKKQGKLPANYILLRTAGKMRPIPKFAEKWHLRGACCIAGGGLYKGIGKVLGMDLIEVKGATGDAETDIAGKIRAAKKSLKKYDFCYLHIKATDNFGHDGDFLSKKKFIEKFDKNLKPILPSTTPRGLSLSETMIVVTSDHCTPCALKEHSSDPVPVLVHSPNPCLVKPEKVNISRFSERHCKKGKLGKIKSIDFLKIIFKM